MSKTISMSDIVQNYDNVLLFKTLSKKAIDEHKNIKSLREQYEKERDQKCHENYDRVREIYRKKAETKTNSHKKVLIIRIVICLVFALAYIAGVLWFLKKICGIEAMGILPGLFIYGTIISICWLLSMLLSESTALKVILGILTFSNMGMFAGFICLILRYFLTEDFEIDVEIRLEEREMKKFESSKRYLDEIAEANEKDKKETAKRHANAEAKLSELFNKNGEYTWLYKEWQKMVQEVRKNCSSSAAIIIRELTDEKIMDVVLEKIGKVNSVTGSITYKVGFLTTTHNVFEGTYAQLLHSAGLKAQDDWDACQKEIERFNNLWN